MLPKVEPRVLPTEEMEFATFCPVLLVLAGPELIYAPDAGADAPLISIVYS